MTTTKPMQIPSTHRLSVDVVALHDVWRARARDPREHVDERGRYWLTVRWNPFVVPAPPILPAALPADARAPTIRAAPSLRTGDESGALYRLEHGPREGEAERVRELFESLPLDPAIVLPPTLERFEDASTVEELELWLMANKRAPNEAEVEAMRKRWARELAKD